MARLRRWTIVSRGLALTALLVVLFSTAGVVEARDVAVNMGDNFFDPATVTVAVGDRVIWTHTGNRPHDVTADNGAFSSPRRMANGQTFAYTATAPGTYTYLCTVHPAMMKGTLVVQGAAAGMPRTGAGGMAGDPLGDLALICAGLAALVGVAAAAAWRRATV
jgi:plastocyanin